MVGDYAAAPFFDGNPNAKNLAEHFTNTGKEFLFKYVESMLHNSKAQVPLFFLPISDQRYRELIRHIEGLNSITPLLKQNWIHSLIHVPISKEEGGEETFQKLRINQGIPAQHQFLDIYDYAHRAGNGGLHCATHTIPYCRRRI